ncbi:uncharacterized protein LOC120780734 [Bactrocera tryoni]|uniref:uncharacterized protein LOC120780734 n=1 Tax=Bactrocera tryoni TaxID=59916 RepID=UPI001A968ECC|nr:uncharacterized protein LOC120780734 [Bactrocera tryoni]
MESGNNKIRRRRPCHWKITYYRIPYTYHHQLSVEAYSTTRQNYQGLAHMLQSSRINTLNFQDETDEKLRQANTFVQTLRDEQIIYRTFDHPVGNVQNIPYGVKYCIQGYFLPSSGTMYEFVSYHPLMQYYGFTPDGTSMEVLRPPVLLHSKEFNRIYQDELEVLNAKDLHMQPPYCVPCINVSSPDIISRFLFNLSSNKKCSIQHC